MDCFDELMSNTQHFCGSASMKKSALKLSEPWKWWRLLEVFLIVVSLCCLVFAGLFVCCLTVLSCVCWFVCCLTELSCVCWYVCCLTVLSCVCWFVCCRTVLSCACWFVCCHTVLSCVCWFVCCLTVLFVVSLCHLVFAGRLRESQQENSALKQAKQKLESQR